MKSHHVGGLLVSVVMGMYGGEVHAGVEGYYRQPALSGNTVVFVSEGDLWKVPLSGGIATRLTSHAGDEGSPAISPDGTTVAFTAQYEGPNELYTMPIDGGLPTRWTYDGVRWVIGWTGDGKVMYASDSRSTLPSVQTFVLDPRTRGVRLLPLAEASDGVFDGEGTTLFFVRLAFQGSQTKRYKGGTAQQIWRWEGDGKEATILTGEYPGTSKRPMWHRGRVYFLTDRDGFMNVWSMTPDGTDLKQHTKHVGFDVLGGSLGDGKIIYQLGADLRVLDLTSGNDALIKITLDSDFDQTRERWVKKPMEYMTSAHISHDGERVAITARGRMYVAPTKQGRFVEVPQREGVRHREARFMPDGKTLLTLSDASDEVELWTYPANGVGEPIQLTSDGRKLRWEALPSPDGKLIAHHDKNLTLWIYDVEKKTNTKIDENPIDNFEGLAWSPDSQWLAYTTYAFNMNRQVKAHRVSDGQRATLTTDRYDSFSPAWSTDGKWMYVLSDRHLDSKVSSPWGTMQPEPYWDKRTKVYQIALKAGVRSPFAPMDELEAAKKKDEADEKKKDEKPDSEKADAAKAKAPEAANAEPSKDDKAQDRKPDDKKDKKVKVEIDVADLERRIQDVPIPPGNYTGLMLNDKALFWISRDSGDGKASLQGMEITNDKPEVKTVLTDIRGAEMSGDGRKFLVQKGDALHVIDAKAASADTSKSAVDLSGWTMSISPREEWRQIFREAWRLERDYFYDTNMHGVDWKGSYERYLPLVDRVATRAELSDVIAQMVSDLSALHIFVRGGDTRSGDDSVMAASLGAVLERDEKAGGYRVVHVYKHDPDEPDQASPLAKPGVEVVEGDVITMINGVATLSVPDIAVLLRQKAGKQVLAHVKVGAPGEGKAAERDVIVTPISGGRASDLRYDEWEYTRRLRVDEQGQGELGYVHLRAMGEENMAEWVKNYFPVFTRKGLIIDVRHNRGGNIDSWILNRLLRKAWMYWNQHAGRAPLWNMQYAFRGHMVVLCNERTASDGEAFAEGFKRLGLGKVIGKRTWGGEIWLSSSNFLVDRGIATAAEMGVFGPEGDWLIEGWGVEPDIVVDNLPHATFKGEDTQLDAAIKHLRQLIKEKPVELPPVPTLPDKSFKGK